MWTRIKVVTLVYSNNVLLTVPVSGMLAMVSVARVLFLFIFFNL